MKNMMWIALVFLFAVNVIAAEPPLDDLIQCFDFIDDYSDGVGQVEGDSLEKVLLVPHTLRQNSKRIEGVVVVRKSAAGAIESLFIAPEKPLANGSYAVIATLPQAPTPLSFPLERLSSETYRIPEKRAIRYTPATMKPVEGQLPSVGEVLRNEVTARLKSSLFIAERPPVPEAQAKPSKQFQDEMRQYSEQIRKYNEDIAARAAKGESTSSFPQPPSPPTLSRGQAAQTAVDPLELALEQTRPFKRVVRHVLGQDNRKENAELIRNGLNKCRAVISDEVVKGKIDSSLSRLNHLETAPRRRTPTSF